jgi:hypothetical protein
MLSLRKGKSFARRCQNSTTSAIRISATTGVPVGSLITPLLLTGVQAGQRLREDPNARPFLDDSDDDDDAQEEKTADIESMAASAFADDAPVEAMIGNSDV